MTSIMTNAAAMAALQTLRNINMHMETTQARVSSGYRVENAADNAAYWSIATTMRSDNKALSTVSDAIGLGAAKVDVAYTGLNNAIKVVDEIKAKLVAATEPAVDRVKINSELTELKNQLRSTAESASFSGENWLYSTAVGGAGTAQIVASFNRSSDGKVSVGTLDVDVSATVLIDTDSAARGLLTGDIDADALLAAPTGTADYYFLIDAAATTAGAATGTEIALSATTTDAEVSAMLRVADNILESLTDAASSLGAVKSRVDMQNDFVNTLMDAITEGVGRLVDADMNQESTRLKALQTQQQLGIQALSIANNSSQNILALFRQ
ncbi:flagellin [Hoeflea prorocentri]|uniref:Flagellin n=1 Tax=Hoeflea prorocentri TaxID=1922333 RepID=A0A9X3UKT6_9HYPH|nr:flagellin [Hoeflea prorocentri]MCY6382387.1 flagellin [Hoeflea prorocentri]MDA5400187.1 flagellin [Hoeflea prorocentri]